MIDQEEIVAGAIYPEQVAVWPDELEKLEASHEKALADIAVLQSALEVIASHREDILIDRSAYAFVCIAEKALQVTQQPEEGE